jgi:hypothetical protein
VRRHCAEVDCDARPARATEDWYHAEYNTDISSNLDPNFGQDMERHRLENNKRGEEEAQQSCDLCRDLYNLQHSAMGL